ncbi:MAG: hypothetical protein IBJ11_12445 [Phycisphaerales bacterium]|nr:hypothetical protein [Phycisphaerales bacterium]
MSVVVGGNPVGSMAPPAGMAAGVRAGASRPGGLVLALMVAVGLAFVAVFFRWLDKQFGWHGFSATKVDDWGHAFIVPLMNWGYWCFYTS